VKDVQKEKFGTTAFLIKRYFKKNSSASGHITDSGLRPRVPVYLDGGWIRLIDGMVEVHPDNKRFPTKEFASEREALNYLANSTVATDSGLRPKDIKRGPGAFTVQLTDPDGSEHVEPVSSLRTYDSKHVKDGLLEQLCQKHDAIKWHPSRNDDLAVPLRSSEALQAYAHTHSDIVRLLQDAVSLLNKSSAVNKANWRGRVERVKKDVATAEAKARGGDYKGAVALQESALMLAHEILDELLRLSRSKAVGGKATDAVSVETLQKKLDAAEKRLQNVRDAISMATYRRTNKGQRIQSSAEMTARGKFNDASSAVREAKAALEAVGGKATDGLFSNTAMLLAALYAWYRSRMDAPALQPRNYDLTTYTPRQRLLDSVDLAREKRIRALGKIEPHRYETPKPGSASLPCKKCGLSYWAAEHSTK
jgi:hypothetical protein